MDRDNSGAVVLSAQIVTQHPQLFTSGGMSSSTESARMKFYKGEPLALGYMLSGSLTVAAARNPKMPIMKAMLGLNVLSAIAAGLGIVILSISLALSDVFWHGTYTCYNLDAGRIRQCYENQVIPHYVQTGMMAIFLLFNILEFCISISGAAFGCKASCQESFIRTVVVVYQNKPPGDADSLPAACKDAENP